MDGGPIHDACTILYLLEPNLFYIDIEYQKCTLPMERWLLI